MSEQEKHEVWEKLKRVAPEIAEAMKRHVEVFGKPKDIRVRWLDETR